MGDIASPAEFNPRKPDERRTDLWTWPGSVVAPSADTIVVAERKRVWVVNVKEQTLERLDLPARSFFPNSEYIVGDGGVSPDGQVVMFPLAKQRVAFPYLIDNWVYTGTDFAILELNPLRLLRIVHGGNGKATTASAVNHRDGRVEVLVFRDNHWQRDELRP
jgi:hypothetical protein